MKFAKIFPEPLQSKVLKKKVAEAVLNKKKKTIRNPQHFIEKKIRSMS